MKKKLYLIDVSNMFFRAFYAIRALSTPSGLPTNAIYGFVSMIIKLLKDEKPDYIAFCYDLPSGSFRSDIYPEYKAHRSETPSDLIPQIPYIRKIVNAFGFPAFEKEGFEADDLIGSLSHFARKNNCDVVIVSGDKDFSQLVDDHIKLLDTMKSHLYDSHEIKEKWGVTPEQFIDYLALVGDASDNIPGVDGIGLKGAQKLISEYGSLDGVYKNIENIKGSLKDKLIAGKENAYTSQKLVTIVTDLDLKIEMKNLERTEINYDELKNLIKELNFKNLESQLFGPNQHILMTHQNGGKDTIIDSSNNNITKNEIDKNIEKENNNTIISDTLISNCEGESIIPVYPTDLQKILSSCKFESGIIPIWIFNRDHQFHIFIGEEFSKNENHVYQLIGAKEDWQNLFSKFKISWFGFDLKKIWRELNLKNPVAAWDSMVAAYLIKSEPVDNFEETITEFLLQDISQITSVHAFFKLQIQLKTKLEQLINDNHLNKIFYEIEIPLIGILLEMELNGILIDIAVLKKMSEKLDSEIKSIEKQIYELVGHEFNISSPKQLGSILFEKLQLPTQKKTKTGFSTDNEVLEKLKDLHPCILHILNYREMTKLKSTYVDALPALADPKTNRVHTHFNQTLAATGRLSSTHPNLQNIPIRTERGVLIRRAFIAPPKKVLLSLDYSQIELRILAHITKDEGLTKAFIHGQDIHTATAAEVFGVSLSDVNSEMRRAAKAVNFGIAYGQGAFGLAENLGIPRKEAQEIIHKYFEKFSGVKIYMENIVKEAHLNGFVSTFLGRRRVLKDIHAKNQMLKKFAERAAINAPMQGAASDIVKLAMIEVYPIKEAKLLLQVHDELVFEVDEAIVNELQKKLTHIMENVVQLSVPLRVNGSIGPNWDS